MFTALCALDKIMDIDHKKIETKEELLELMIELSKGDPSKWENISTTDFLEAMAAWLGSAENFYKNFNLETDANSASWQLFGDALQAAIIYE